MPLTSALLPIANLSPTESQEIQSIGSQDSMATVPVDYDILLSDGEDGPSQKVKAWGRLYPAGKIFDSFGVTDLIEDEYTIGRDEECNIVLSSTLANTDQFFLSYSKKHFKINREILSTGEYGFLYDLSSNGTFINGEKVGKGKKQVLNNNDEIALATNKNKAFVYMTESNTSDSYPLEISSRYIVSKELGRGACGEVKLAFEKGSCKKVAIKIIQKKSFSSINSSALISKSQSLNEVKILKAIKHPCIIDIEDVIATDDVLYIILELMEGGELFDRVVSKQQLPDDIAKLYFYQMVNAIKYLHDQNITHRDLKPENILLMNDDDETIVKVTDFGLSKFVDSRTLMTTFCGTPNYLAPEILITGGSGSYTKAIDCWSLGVILFIMLVGYPPFTDDRDDMELHKQIKGGHVEYPKKFWKDISKTAIELCKGLLTVDTSKRFTMDDCLNHEWLKDEEMKAKAHKLMYPEDGLMLPPTLKPKKRKITDDEISPVKKL